MCSCNSWLRCIDCTTWLELIIYCVYNNNSNNKMVLNKYIWYKPNQLNKPLLKLIFHYYYYNMFGLWLNNNKRKYKKSEFNWGYVPKRDARAMVISLSYYLNYYYIYILTLYLILSSFATICVMFNDRFTSTFIYLKLDYYNPDFLDR